MVLCEEHAISRGSVLYAGLLAIIAHLKQNESPDRLQCLEKALVLAERHLLLTEDRLEVFCKIFECSSSEADLIASVVKRIFKALAHASQLDPQVSERLTRIALELEDFQLARMLHDALLAHVTDWNVLPFCQLHALFKETAVIEEKIKEMDINAEEDVKNNGFQAAMPTNTVDDEGDFENEWAS